MSAENMCKFSLLALVKLGKVAEATDLLLSEPPSPDDLHAQEDSDGDALFWASCRGYALVVELILTLGANVDSVSRASGATPLHAAADNGHTDILRLLLKWGSDTSARNNFHDTPCHLAAYRGHSKCVASLLKAGTASHLRNSRSNTVLDEAKHGQLVEAGGDHTLVQHLIYAYEHSGSQAHDNLDNHRDRSDNHRDRSDNHRDRSDNHRDQSDNHRDQSDRSEHLSYLGRRHSVMNKEYVHNINTRSGPPH